MKIFLLLITLVVGGLCAWKFLTPHRATTAAPGAHLATDPVQTSSSQPPFQQQGYTISPVANYEMDARVLSIHSYNRDQGADLMPFDLALGWGPMSDLRKLSNLSFSQSDRGYSWHVSKLPAPVQDIARYSANTHIIPANPQVRAAIAGLNPGQLVSLHGRLVNVTGPSGWHKNTSLTRGDTGPSADELFYVDSAIPFGDEPSHNDLLSFPIPPRTVETASDGPSPSTSRVYSSTTRIVTVSWPAAPYSAAAPVQLPTATTTVSTKAAPPAPTTARIQSAPAPRPAPVPRATPPAARAPVRSSSSP